MEAYLKKLCFEYQVDEREVKELLARMEMVYLDKGETIASATLPEQSLYIIVSGILHTYTTHEGEGRVVCSFNFICESGPSTDGVSVLL